jgi:Rieske Fe-S protein
MRAPRPPADADPPEELQCDALLPPHRLTRRAVFGVLGGLAAAGCSKSAKWSTKPVAAEQGIVELDLKDYPELATPGGMIAVKPSGSKGPVLVMRIENDDARVMSLRCPHLGCTVRWNNEVQLLDCPCHGSQFDDHGRKVRGPSKSGLEQYPSQRVGTKLQFKIPQG